MCDDECESVSHVLLECPAYSSLRSNFLVGLQGKLGDDGFENFQSLDSFRKASFILGSELWEDRFGSLLGLVKGFILDVWELGYTAIIPAYNRPSLRLRLGSCRVSLVEGVS